MPLDFNESAAQFFVLKQTRDIPDFPKPGITFKDMTPLLAYPEAFQTVIDEIADSWILYDNPPFDVVAGIEARGFIIGSALAYATSTGFVPIRKPGKLPHTTHAITYDLEYGTDTLEVHTDAFTTRPRVLLVDDVLATGGTAQAAVSLIEKAGGSVVSAVFLLELGFLNGRSKLSNVQVDSVLVV